MDYNTLLDLATDLGYRLAMSGAETFRIEESINRVLLTYKIPSEVFAIPNCLTVSIETPDGIPITRMRRIGHHGNDLDSVERYSNLSRKICAEAPSPEVFAQWLRDTDASRVTYSLPAILFGDFLGAVGFAMFFGSSWLDGICAGLCGVLTGGICILLDRQHTNQFFRTIFAAFAMALAAYLMGKYGLVHCADSVIIGALMILVPGLLFTNAMRDIIFGDTNSGMNRIIQVFLTAVAIALGTAAAWSFSNELFGLPPFDAPVSHGFWVQELGCLIGCIGFSILFNIHGPGGLLCALGGTLAWAAYLLTVYLGGNDLTGYFWAAVVSSAYSESMARIRKYPAISYLVVSIFPLIPGASIYYSMSYAVQGDMPAFATTGIHTVAIAGVLAVGILVVSTLYRLWGILRRKAYKKPESIRLK